LLLRRLSLQCPHELRDPTESLAQPAVIRCEADAYMPQPTRPEQVARRHLDALLLQQPIRELSSGQSHLPDRHPEEETADRPTGLQPQRLEPFVSIPPPCRHLADHRSERLR